MSAGEKNTYSKGYYAGCRRSDAALAIELEISKRAAERAERAEAKAGVGHCSECATWDSPQGCAWGYCRVKRQAGSPFGTWMRSDEQITTSPTFGCVLFSSKAPA